MTNRSNKDDVGSGEVPAPGSRGAIGDLGTALAGNLLILAPLAVAAALQTSSDLYYRSVQEDELLEWASFWAFLLAAGVTFLGAIGQRRATGKLPWFLTGLSLFCFFVAMEEISWGQRIFGYRPPVYFLENNFQQELNLHNVVDTGLRKLALKGIILGYGVVLALLALVPPVRRFLRRAAVVAPPAVLVPSFLATFFVYQSYPWKHSGEWVELMLGFGFLCAAIATVTTFRSSNPPSSRLSRPAVLIAGAGLLVVALGAANTLVSRGQRGSQPEILALVDSETEALKRDFLSGEVSTRCNLHKRLYAFKEKYRQDYLLAGEFAALTQQGLPEERAEFFLDPWNSPYWIRDRCKKKSGRRIIFVYSFGPNRRRDSSPWEISGDDVGVIIASIDPEAGESGSP